MSDGQKTRRRFLADLLFLGGALGAGAFLMQSSGEAAGPEPLLAQAQPTPEVAPSQCPPAIRGEATISPPPPPLAGKPSAPPPPPTTPGSPAPTPPASPPHAPQMDGDVAVPQPPKPPQKPPTIEGRSKPPSPPTQR